MIENKNRVFEKRRLGWGVVKPIALILLAFTFSVHANAQKKDTLETIRTFMHVCNVYKQLPLHLEVEMQNTTNFITSEEDTSSAQAAFYITPGDSYIRFGEVEQLVNDSVALLVSDKLQRIILFSNAQPVLARMKMLTGVQLQDSSISALAKKFIAQDNSSGVHFKLSQLSCSIQSCFC